MDKETIARIIVAVGYALVKKYPPSQVKNVSGENDQQSYQYSGSFSQEGFLMREDPGSEVVEVKPSLSEPTKFDIFYKNQKVAEIVMSGSSGSARDTYTSSSYSSINLSSSSIQMGDFRFEVK